ncbi:uncharacterized protein DUF3108 [Pseudomonas duriflava]|uniref:Uncharacterized protein DUF3108 n=1 Tax=Pseudomonas duriflava TaxID=459528 RepID=A0A562QP94_9PSED|nr:DUF3108 domain-containing protein [Pseudomonas duriflava]TWI58581.1 uncharacterized protein DUF3108 [Pseudomonas duriflava]
MRRLLFLLACALALPAHAFDLKPFSATYTADWKQMPMSGSAERSLTQQQDGIWKLEFNASMLVAGLSESSTFRYQGDAFLPVSYTYSRHGLGKSRGSKLSFDWANKKVTGTDRKDPVSLPLDRGLVDKSTYQLLLQHDVADGKKSMSYQVVDGDEIDTYDFRVIGEERVRTQVGLIDAIKVERVRDPTKSSRKTELWFAKNWGYLLVRLYQMETDGKEYQIMLKEGIVEGKPVKGSSN